MHGMHPRNRRPHPALAFGCWRNFSKSSSRSWHAMHPRQARYLALPHSGWPTILKLACWVCGANPSTLDPNRFAQIDRFRARRCLEERGRRRRRGVHSHPSYHARVLEGVAKSQSPLKAVVFKTQQSCPDTVSLHLDPLQHSGVVCLSLFRLPIWWPRDLVHTKVDESIPQIQAINLRIVCQVDRGRAGPPSSGETYFSLRIWQIKSLHNWVILVMSNHLCSNFPGQILK